jgi:hypothetical protein
MSRRSLYVVTPAKAGGQAVFWIPAFAGMTGLMVVTP